MISLSLGENTTAIDDHSSIRAPWRRERKWLWSDL